MKPSKPSNEETAPKTAPQRAYDQLLAEHFDEWLAIDQKLWVKIERVMGVQRKIGEAAWCKRLGIPCREAGNAWRSFIRA